MCATFFSRTRTRHGLTKAWVPILAFAFLGATAFAVIPGAPSSLRVNDVSKPVGTGTAPYFGWHVNDEDLNEIQTAYRILVASDENTLAANIGDLWDSGIVPSRRQNHVPYSGSPLQSDHPYFWKVKTWDNNGNGGAWSAPASFTVGLNDNADWTGAKWIRRDSTDADDYTYFRTSTALAAKTVKRATAYITSAHKYALYVNGTLVGKGPAYHYPQYQYYNAYDITSLVNAGSTNQFAVFNHWFGGGQGRPAGERGLIMKAVVHFTDGSSTIIGTDGTWKQAQATAWSLDGLKQRQAGEGVGYVEKIVATHLIPDWHTPGFDDSAWETATVIGAHPVSPWTGTMAPDLSRISEKVIAPASITDLGSGKYVVDLGKVYAGIPRIVFSGGSSNTTVNMRGGYVLDNDGEIDPAHNQSTDMSYYATLDGGIFTYEPAEYLGMRYFQIDNAPMAVTPDNFEFIVRHSQMDTDASSFSSSDTTLNSVWDFMKHSILTCAQEEFVDTPTREKGGFLGDAAIQSMVAMPVMNERLLSRRSLGEFLQSMDQHWSGTGRMNAVYPNKDGARDIPDYTQAYLTWVWSYYMETGDLAFLLQNYTYFKAIADYVHAAEDNGLVSNLPGGGGAYLYGIVDWPATMRFGYDMTYARTVINGWAYADYDIMAKIAAEVDMPADQVLYQGYADNLANSMTNLISESGIYMDGLDSNGNPSTHASQQANMFPLALGIVPSNHTASVVNRIKELEMSSGMVTLPWLVRAIGEADEGEHLIELFTNEDWLGWAQCIAKGATATWESWDADAEGQSMSHAWGAAGLEGYVRYILGVKPALPQYEKVQIKPLDFGAALGAAAGTIPTDRGTIEVDWQNSHSNAQYTLQITLPNNMTADIAVPRGAAAEPVVYLNGNAVTAIDDGSYLWLEDVGSGNHSIERTTSGPVVVPTAPKFLNATAVSPNQINLTWEASDGADSYVVARSDTSGGYFSTIASGITDTNFSDTGLAATTTYFYVVGAVSDTGGIGPLSTEAIATTTSDIQISPTATMNGSITSSSGPTLVTTDSFDMNGGNTVALLVTAKCGSGSPALSAAFAGQPMTLGESINQSYQWSGIFYLIDPATSEGSFVITSAGGGADVAYSAIALNNVDDIADSDSVANSTSSYGGTVSLDYTTTVNNGYVLGAVVNAGWSLTWAPEFVSGNADQIHQRICLNLDSGHLHTYGAVAAAGDHTDIYANLKTRNAFVTLAFNPTETTVVTDPVDPYDLGNIWPLGDSITEGVAGYGYRLPGGYREPLYTNLTDRGYTFNFVGSWNNNASTLLTSNDQDFHDGHSGWTIADIEGRSGLYEQVIDWYASISKPHVILLMIGINDLNHDWDIDTAPDRLANLIQRIFALDPHVRLIVSSLIDADQNNPYRGTPAATNNISDSVNEYNAAIALLVAALRANGYNIEFVDMNAGLSLADLDDGLHPNDGGHVKMGNIWADAIVADPPTFSSNGISVTNGMISLTASGGIGTSYSLWTTTNLIPNVWTLLDSGNISTTPFTILEAAAEPSQFYRFTAP